MRCGRKAACDAVTFDVSEGECFALLGRNGAGKSSLVRCVLGLRKPDEGAASLLGQDAWAQRASLVAGVGSVPEEPDAPGNLSATQLALALGHSPELLIRDDPTLGLDVVARDLVFAEIRRERASRPVTVLLTTEDGFQ